MSREVLGAALQPPDADLSVRHLAAVVLQPQEARHRERHRNLAFADALAVKHDREAPAAGSDAEVVPEPGRPVAARYLLRPDARGQKPVNGTGAVQRAAGPPVDGVIAGVVDLHFDRPVVKAVVQTERRARRAEEDPGVGGDVARARVEERLSPRVQLDIAEGGDVVVEDDAWAGVAVHIEEGAVLD